jgi:hypothetical protein
MVRHGWKATATLPSISPVTVAATEVSPEVDCRSWHRYGQGDRIVDDVQIKLSALWVALMLTYLLGDVLRIFSGDFKPGEIGGVQIAQSAYLGIAVLMVIPIVMVFLSLTLNHPANRWANIIVAVLFFGFNLIGLPTYPSAYDKFLIIVGLAFNVLTVWYAWRWV